MSADFSERLIRACAELPKMCEFFHVPFQSGDNDILREMKCADDFKSPFFSAAGRHTILAYTQEIKATRILRPLAIALELCTYTSIQKKRRLRMLSDEKGGSHTSDLRSEYTQRQ